MKRVAIAMALLSVALVRGAAATSDAQVVHALVRDAEATNDAQAVQSLYDATGVRDPLVKPLNVPIRETGSLQVATLQTRQSRRAEIERLLATCRIEGVVVSAALRMAVINDRLLGEGDRLAPDVAVRIARISVDRIVFALDKDTYDYKLSPPPETPR